MIVFTCGGTGGHVYPAIALAQELAGDFFFIGSNDRPDSAIIQRYGYPFHSLFIPPNGGVSIVRSFFKAVALLSKHRVKLVVSTGGLLTIPVCFAAFFLRIPIFLLEQNSIPGRGNRLLNLISTRNFIAFKKSQAYFSEKKTKCLGNPVRKQYLKDDISAAYESLPWSSAPRLLVFGGSQGSFFINDLLKDCYPTLCKKGLNVVHITGPGYFRDKMAQKSEYLIIPDAVSGNTVFVAPYFESMDCLYQDAALVVCRAGATSIAELQVFNRKHILIPYPYAKDNHQVLNAKEMESPGFSLNVQEKELSGERLLAMIDSLINGPEPSHKWTNTARQTIAADIRSFI